MKWEMIYSNFYWLFVFLFMMFEYVSCMFPSLYVVIHVYVFLRCSFIQYFLWCWRAKSTWAISWPFGVCVCLYMCFCCVPLWNISSGVKEPKVDQVISWPFDVCVFVCEWPHTWHTSAKAISIPGGASRRGSVQCLWTDQTNTNK